MAIVDVGGSCDGSFRLVRDAFIRNFEPTETDEVDDVGDVGAAVCVVVGGRMVVDLWGGSMDDAGRRPWTEATLVNAYSTMKPVAAVVALQAVANGLVDLDLPLRASWSALTDPASEGTTLRQVLCHQAGLPAIAAPVRDDDLYDWSAMCAAVGSTPPWWAPGSGHGYHVNTYGFAAGGPAVESSGVAFGELVRRNIAGPRGLDMHVGVAGADLARCADVIGPINKATAPSSSSFFAPDDGTARSTMLRNAYLNPVGISGIAIVNTEAWRRAQVPSTNGHATASALAGFYAATLPGSSQPILPESLMSEAITAQADGDDIVLERPMRYGFGFNLASPDRPLGLSPSSYGHYGYGGSLGFADRNADVAFGYLINRPGDRWRNPRTLRLVDALAECL